MRKTLAFVSALTLVVGLSVVGCQTYDFEPVTPLAINQQSFPTTVVGTSFTPTLMLVVDRSGSMSNPTDSTNPNCTVGGKLCGETNNITCPSNCPTRITDVQKAMGDFLTTNGALAMMGLTAFPVSGGDQCQAAAQNNILVQIPSTDDAATLQTTATNINSKLQALSPGGGTPTSDTLKNLATYSGLLNTSRSNFIMLLTDGEPNCNGNNPNNCCSGPNPPAGNCSLCSCTLANASSCTQSNSNVCSIGCLDQDTTVATIASLKAQGIDTFVVGFGSDTAITGGDGKAPAALTAMALAGGEPRGCTTDADCTFAGNADTCVKSTGLCTHPYYQAGNAQDLAGVLAKIKGVVSKTPCQQQLSQRPTDARFLSVIVNGTDTPSGPDTWNYDSSNGVVHFTGALCNRLENSTPQSPVTIEYRVVQKL